MNNLYNYKVQKNHERLTVRVGGGSSLTVGQIVKYPFLTTSLAGTAKHGLAAKMIVDAEQLSLFFESLSQQRFIANG